MSVEPRFVDTNVLVYLFDADAPEGRPARGRFCVTNGTGSS